VLADDSTGAARAFRFGPRDRRGLLAGMRAGQLAPVLAALAVALAALRSVGGAAGAALALVALGGGLVVGFVPVAGRSLDEWAWCAGAFAVGRWRGGFRSSSLYRSRRGPFRHLQIVELGRLDGRPLGAIRDHREGRVTAVLSLRADGFALLGAAERARQVAAWSGLLAAVATQSAGIERVCWIERTLPGSASALHHPVDGAPDAAASSYEALLAAEARNQLCHELLLACSLPSRGAGAARGKRPSATPSTPEPSAGAPASSAPAGRLVAEVERLIGRCRAAGVAVERALAPTELAAVIRSSTAGEPAASVWPWPVGVREEWGCLRTDESWHATYWIAEWPRSAVGSDFLLPLLVGCWLRRAVAVVMAPFPPQRAIRATEQARTEKVADLELRKRHGFALTARLAQEQEAVERRAQELAGGHAAYRFSGYVTVSSDSRPALEEACRSLEQAATLARLELRRLYGAQAEGFCCTLPTGRGCR
jgi:hypothetical protein